MNILIINLTRFGDLLQSQAAITSLVREGHCVGMACLENFAEAAVLLSGVSHVAPVSCSSLLPRRDPETGRFMGWQKALASLAVWRERLYENFIPDKVCNLTPTLSARLFAFFVGRGVPCQGFTVDEHGFGVNTNAWAGFMQGAIQAREVSPFNVVDIFRKIAAQSPVREPVVGDASLCLPPENLRIEARERLLTESPPGCRGLVAFQLGASEDRRRWPLENFAELGDTLWKQGGFCPVLLGSKAEMPLADRYRHAAAHPFIDMCGQTGLTELAATLCATRLLVTNDTGTMHLAAGLGLPVLAVFLATAQPFDTGPYLAESCSLEPDLECHPCAFGSACQHDQLCRKTISPQLMAGLALSRLERNVWQIPESVDRDAAARVWLSTVESDGSIGLESLSGHGDSGRAVWLAMQRHYISRFLDRDDSRPFEPELFSYAGPLPGAMRSEIINAIDNALILINLFLQQGQVLMHNSAPLMQKRFLANWEKIRDNLGQNNSLKALAVLWAQQTQSPGQDLPHVITVAQAFEGMLRGIRGTLG